MPRALLLAALALLLPGLAGALEFSDDFASRREGWQTLSGDWAWKQGGLFQKRAADGYSYAMRAETLTEGVVTVEATATAANSSGDGCVGVLCKYLDDRNWLAVRCGAYKGLAVMMVVDGAKELPVLSSFRCEVGRRYTCRVTLAQGLLQVEVDGKPLGVCRDPFAGRAGHPGVYAQSPACFHRFTVGGPPQSADTTQAAREALATGPQVLEPSATWALEGVEFAAAPLSPTLSGPDRATLAVYLRNRRDRGAPAELTRLELDGIAAPELLAQGRLAWWQALPSRVAPGAVTQVLVKFASFPLPQAAQAQAGAPVGPYRLRLAGTPGGPLTVRFALSPEPPPLRINFLAFAPGLQRLYVYVAGEGKLAGQRVERVEVNGQDVTGRLRPEVGRLAPLRPDTLPLTVDLPEPLVAGAPTVVRVTAGGVTAGHALRAFASRFPVQVVILGKQPGPAEVHELAGLCFTEVGLCGGRAQNLGAMAQEGLLYFPYAYPGAKALETYLGQPARPPLSAWWIDEIDGSQKTPQDARQMLREADALMDTQGLPPAPYCLNLIAPWADRGYAELADALSHEYGIDFGLSDAQGWRQALDLLHPGDLARRELRTARRPFWPYFRNLEAAVLLDPQTKQIVGQYRPLDPREHRLLVYSCLANGAKGALNWNYGVNYLTPQTSDWLSKQYDAIRLNMTAQKSPEAFGVTIPPELLEGLRVATAECGRVNAELQLLGPLLAIGDVSALATVTRCVPEKNPRGGPGAFARAIVCGSDTIVLVALNLNIDSNLNARKPQPVKSYEPVAAQVRVTVPPWLQVADVFGVTCRGVEPCKCERSKGAAVLGFPALGVAEAVVLTADRGLRGRLAEQLPALQERLRGVGVAVQ